MNHSISYSTLAPNLVQDPCSKLYPWLEIEVNNYKQAARVLSVTTPDANQGIPITSIKTIYAYIKLAHSNQTHKTKVNHNHLLTHAQGCKSYIALLQR
jgi:hypothetical protein